MSIVGRKNKGKESGQGEMMKIMVMIPATSLIANKSSSELHIKQLKTHVKKTKPKGMLDSLPSCTMCDSLLPIY